jgi:hypothetical protein
VSQTQSKVLQPIQPVLDSLAEAGLAAGDGVAAMAWLVGPGDVCGACPNRPQCPSQVSCLHLVARAGDPPDEDRLRRVPIGAGAIGRVPVTHFPSIARADLADLGLAHAPWFSRHRVHSVAVFPLEHGGRCIGVLAVLSRGELPEEQVRLLSASVRLGAEAIGNVSAYRDLAADRNRLAARNARLRSGLGLPPEPEPEPVRTRAPAAATLRTDPTTPELPAVSPAAQREVPPPLPSPALVSASGAMLHPDAGSFLPLRSFAEVQREGIMRALERTGWRVSGPRGAAAVLRLKPTTLESKMKKLGIRRPQRLT